jgi:hypothetical protein
LLYQRAKDYLDKIDIIAVAPLHKKRLQKRKFNQSVLLAKSMKKFLTTEKFQQSVSSGLVEYGKFYTGNEVKELEPGSIEFSANGIRYQVN